MPCLLDSSARIKTESKTAEITMNGFGEKDTSQWVLYKKHSTLRGSANDGTQAKSNPTCFYSTHELTMCSTFLNG